MRRIALIGFCTAAYLLIANSVGISQENAPKKPRRTDAEGLGLPDGAVARLGTLRGVNDKEIEFLALSADGKKAATAPQFDPTLRIWEVPSGKLLEEIALKIEFWDGMALSPDFQKLAWTYLDNSVTIMDLATRKQTVLNTPVENDAREAAVSFASDGKKVVVTFRHHYSGLAPTRKETKEGSRQWRSMFDFEIVEWTLEDGNRRQLWKDDEEGHPYRNVALAPDGKTLACVKKKSAEDVADFEQEFVLADAATRKPRLKLPLKDGADCVMEFSPDGTVLALADEDAFKLIDLAKDKVRWTASFKDKIRRPEARWPSIKQPWPEKVVWLPGGEVGIFFQTGALWTWKTSDGTEVRRYVSQAVKPWACARDVPVMAFAQDGRSLQFLDTAKGSALQPVQGHRNPPNVLFRNDGSLISHDETKICLWNAGDWSFRTSLEFDANGQRFYFGPSQDFFVRTVGARVELRSLEGGKLIREWTLKSAADFVFLLPDGKRLAAGYLFQSGEPQYKGHERLFLRLLDVASGAQHEIALPYQPREVKLSPAKAGLLALRTRTEDRDHVDILDTVSGKLKPLMDDRTVSIRLVEFSADGRKLYFSSSPADSPGIPAEVTFASVELSSGKKATHALTDRINVAEFSADGRFLAFSPVKVKFRIVGGFGRIFTTPSPEIVVWDAVFENVRARLEKTDDWVKSVSCAPNCRFLATGLYDSTILIWDLQQGR